MFRRSGCFGAGAGGEDMGLAEGRLMVAFFVLGLGTASLSLAQSNGSQSPPPDPRGPQIQQLKAELDQAGARALEGTPLSALAPLMGDWVVEGTRSDGTPQWDRHEFRVAVGGRYVTARTFSEKQDGTLHERSLAIYSREPVTGAWKVIDYSAAGLVTAIEDVTVGEGETPEIEMAWDTSGLKIRQILKVRSRDEVDWRILSRSMQELKWRTLSKGTWRRVPNGQ